MFIYVVRLLRSRRILKSLLSYKRLDPSGVSDTNIIQKIKVQSKSKNNL